MAIAEKFLTIRNMNNRVWLLDNFDVNFPCPGFILLECDIYLHSSRAIFIQLHPLQLHILHFLEGIQFSGMMT